MNNIESDKVRYAKYKDEGWTPYEVLCQAKSEGFNNILCMAIVVNLLGISHGEAKNLVIKNYYEIHCKELKNKYLPLKEQGLPAEQIIKQAFIDGVSRADCVILLNLFFDIQQSEAKTLYSKWRLDNIF